MSTAVRGKRFVERVQQTVEKLRESGDLSPFTELLPMESVQRVLDQVGRVFRERIYTPTVTLWVFLSQVLSADHSCDDAVARLLAWRTARGETVFAGDGQLLHGPRSTARGVVHGPRAGDRPLRGTSSGRRLALAGAPGVAASILSAGAAATIA